MVPASILSRSPSWQVLSETGNEGLLLEHTSVSNLRTLHLFVPTPVIELVTNIKTIAKRGHSACHIASLARRVKSACHEYYCHLMMNAEGINSFFDSLVGESP